tara:strand:+ start:9461 stop:9634 length:174 start_codon:yes stop_codon:yes gene_type:complete
MKKKKEYEFKISVTKAGTYLVLFGVPYLITGGSGWGLWVGAILTGAWNAVKFYKFNK